MDGLFQLPDNASPLITVPYVAKFGYDELGSSRSFHDFPRRKGFPLQVSALDGSYFEGRSDEDAASLLQAWLFFGLLQEFSGPLVSPQRPLRPDLPLRFDFVHQQIPHLKERLRVANSSDRQQWVDNIKSCLEVTQSMIEIFDSYTPKQRPSAIPTLALSARLLIEYIRYLIDRFSKEDYKRPLRWFSWGQMSFRRDMHKAAFEALIENKTGSKDLPISSDTFSVRLSVQSLLDCFQGAGWCISQAIKVCKMYEYSVANFLACIRRCYPPGIDHSRCTIHSKCMAHNVKLDQSYEVKHVNPDCHCDFCYVDTFEVKDIISKGGVPLVMMKLGSTKLTVTKARPWTEYIAVSHVWSGGLGNPDHNSLPRCQILRLQKYYRYQTRAQRSILFRLNRLFRSDLVSLFSPQNMYFWMDTLCIPTSGGTIKEKAIQHMAAIYAGASQVLVLDAELQQTFAKKPNGLPRSDNDIAAHVLCSAWMDRAWTLQEGALGKECHFQFKDVSRCIGFENLLEDERNVFRATRRLISGTNVDCSQLIVRLSRLVIDTLQSERQYLSLLPEGTRKDRLSKAWRIPQHVRVWNSLLWRESSYKKDIYTIFANLLDFNTYLLHPSPEGSQSIPPEQANIPVLIRSCKELPLSILYNRGPRIKSLDCPQNGWIPWRLLKMGSLETNLQKGLSCDGRITRWKLTHHECLVRHFSCTPSLRS